MHWPFVTAQTLIVPDPLPEAAIAPWVMVVIAVVLAVGVGVASFKGSKRSHRD